MKRVQRSRRGIRIFQISFGSHCFRNPGGEETMDLIIVSKTEFPDIWEFGKNSIRKMWEWDEIAGIIAHLQKMEWGTTV